MSEIFGLIVQQFFRSAPHLPAETRREPLVDDRHGMAAIGAADQRPLFGAARRNALRFSALRLLGSKWAAAGRLLEI